MPVVIVKGNDLKTDVPRYDWPLRYVTELGGEEVYTRLVELRKEAIKLREEFTHYQKENKDDRELAKFFKEEAKEQLRMEKAITIFCQWLEGGPQIIENTRMWPVGLAREMDIVAYQIMLEFY